MRLLPEREHDVFEVEALYDTAFAPGRRALSSYQLRDGVAPVAPLCRLARDDYDAVVGAIRYWPVLIEGPRAWPALLLGPIAVHHTRQGEGLGALLVVETMEHAAALGWRRVLLVGDEPYYWRFGFRRSLAVGLDFPRPVNFERVLAAELCHNSMRDVSGEVRKWPADRPVVPGE
ncbi:MAG: N-acetyltransferase [Pseudomonadota bacterium]